MTYPAYTGAVLAALGYGDCADVSSVEGEYIITRWDCADAQPTPAEIEAAYLPYRRQQRIAALKAEAEAYIDDSIYPVTRSMLHDGVLEAVTAEAVREFIASVYDEGNGVIDALEAVTDPADIETPAPVWPAYGG